MVMLIRKLVNILFSTSAFTLQSFQIAQLPSNMDMNVDSDIIRGKSTSSSKISLRKSSTNSITSLSPYYKRIKMQNDLLDEDV